MRKVQCTHVYLSKCQYHIRNLSAVYGTPLAVFYMYASAHHWRLFQTVKHRFKDNNNKTICIAP